MTRGHVFSWPLAIVIGAIGGGPVWAASGPHRIVDARGRALQTGPDGVRASSGGSQSTDRWVISTVQDGAMQIVSLHPWRKPSHGLFVEGREIRYGAVRSNDRRAQWSVEGTGATRRLRSAVAAGYYLGADEAGRLVLAQNGAHTQWKLQSAPMGPVRLFEETMIAPTHTQATPRCGVIKTGEPATQSRFLTRCLATVKARSTPPRVDFPELQEAAWYAPLNQKLESRGIRALADSFSKGCPTIAELTKIDEAAKELVRETATRKRDGEIDDRRAQALFGVSVARRWAVRCRLVDNYYKGLRSFYVEMGNRQQTVVSDVWGYGIPDRQAPTSSKGAAIALAAGNVALGILGFVPGVGTLAGGAGVGIATKDLVDEVFTPERPPPSMTPEEARQYVDRVINRHNQAVLARIDELHTHALHSSSLMAISEHVARRSFITLQGNFVFSRELGTSDADEAVKERLRRNYADAYAAAELYAGRLAWDFVLRFRILLRAVRFGSFGYKDAAGEKDATARRRANAHYCEPDFESDLAKGELARATTTHFSGALQWTVWQLRKGLDIVPDIDRDQPEKGDQVLSQAALESLRKHYLGEEILVRLRDNMHILGKEIGPMTYSEGNVQFTKRDHNELFRIAWSRYDQDPPAPTRHKRARRGRKFPNRIPRNQQAPNYEGRAQPVGFSNIEVRTNCLDVAAEWE